MAWRVMLKPAASPVMDVGPSSHRRETSRRRVSSPKAAKIGAEPANLAFVFDLVLGKIFLDQLNYNSPALLVVLECLGAARQRNLIEARFYDGQQNTAGRFLEGELDQRGRLTGVVDTGFNGRGVPAEREQPLRLDPLNDDGELEVRVLLLGLGNFRIYRSACDLYRQAPS